MTFCARHASSISRYSQILFWRFFAPIRDSGLMFSKPEEDRGAAGARRLLDEIRNAVAQRVDLQQQLDVEFVALAQFDQPVEDRLPIAVAGEIVVGDEKPRNALRRIGAHDRLDVVGRAVARFAALHIDDGAEAALERTAAAGIEARIMAGDPRHHRTRQDRIDRRRHFRHVAEIIVDRLRRARPRHRAALRPCGLRLRRRTDECRDRALPADRPAKSAASRCSRRRGSRP